MPTQIQVTLYKFDELDNKAKEKARDWWRKASEYDEFWDASYTDFQEVAARLGIELGQKPVKLMNGQTRYDPAIYFTGFSSQGDGACFEGRWQAIHPNLPPTFDKEVHLSHESAIKAYAPADEMLHAIAREFDKASHYKVDPELQSTQEASHPTPQATTKHSGHYYHSGCMDVESNLLSPDDHGDLATALRMFANWMYDQLQKEHDYYYADEHVDDSIRCNEYDFEEDGTRSRHG